MRFYDPDEDDHPARADPWDEREVSTQSVGRDTQDDSPREPGGQPPQDFDSDDRLRSLFEDIYRALPAAEHRSGQLEMARRVARAIVGRRHLIVQAGTGTGKSIAYLVPAAVSGRRVVVATATKALQDQLLEKDLPLVAEALGRKDLRFCALKGRANYLCRQRAAEMTGLAGPATTGELPLEPDPAGGDSRFSDQLKRLLAWAEESATGDRAELEFEPHPRVWGALSVGPRECPGAFRCPSGSLCFAERARAMAAASDIVVVNTHLYATHVASGGAVLPEHDVLVLDEAHSVEEVMTEALGVELSGARLRAVAQAARAIVGTEEGRIVDAMLEVADEIDRVLSACAGRRVLNDRSPADAELERVLSLTRTARRRFTARSGAARTGGAMRTTTPGACGRHLPSLISSRTWLRSARWATTRSHGSRQRGAPPGVQRCGSHRSTSAPCSRSACGPR